MRDARRDGEDLVGDGRQRGDEDVDEAMRAERRAQFVELVVVAVEVEDGAPDRLEQGHADHILFEISDNGIGMDQETREKAFSLFFSSKGAKGTGLGLFISNNIIKAHGGRIEFESKLDQGTRFEIMVPRARVETELEETAN